MRTAPLELHFDSAPEVRLARTVFPALPDRGPKSAGTPAFVATDQGRATLKPGSRVFQQTRGVKAFALALVRLRRRRDRGRGGDGDHASANQPLLAGGRGSAACALDAVLLRPDASGWLRAMLDPHPEAGGGGALKARLDQWFERRNSNLNNPAQPVRVFIRAHHAAAPTPEQVEIFLDGQPADAASLRAVEAALAADFAEDGATPPPGRAPRPGCVDPARSARYVSTMSLAQLKDQAAHLPPVEQRDLIAFLISRQTERDGEFQDALTRKIDDADPTHWVELDELRKRYAG